MTERQRVLTLLSGKQPDRVPWLGDLSYWTNYLRASGNMPVRYGKEDYALHRDLGVGFYLQGYFPYKEVRKNYTEEEVRRGDTVTKKITTPAGVLTGSSVYLPDSYTWAVSEHFVKEAEDLKVVRSIYENIDYQPAYAEAEGRYAKISDNGVVLCYLPKSPFMEMTALLSSIEHISYIISDEPEEFAETLAVIETAHDKAAQIALDSPAECLMIPENLSSEVVGKAFFHAYMEPYERKWNAKIKAAGKHSFVHMDGTLKGLLSEVSSTGFRVMEALTPKPCGDLAFEEIIPLVPKDTVIWGGLPGMLFSDFTSDEEFDRYVQKLLEIMKTEPRFVLGVADQVPPGVRMERVARVRKLVDMYGNYK